MNGLTEVRLKLKKATRAFLVRDYATVDSVLASLSSLDKPRVSAWFDGTADQVEASDVWRKVDILRINYLATIYASPVEPIASSKSDELEPETVVPFLWNDLFFSPAVGSSSTAGHAGILPSPELAFVHPALVVALVLAAMRLDQPTQAKAAAEAWFGSVDDSIDSKLAQKATQQVGGIDWQDVDLGIGAATAASAVLNANQAGASAKRDKDRELLKSWLKLHDAFVLHVLPNLAEWEQAEEFARAQAVENGGWLPDERVNACIDRLKEIQREEEMAASEVTERQKALDAQRAADKQREKEALKRQREAAKDKSSNKRNTSPSATSGSKKASQHHHHHHHRSDRVSPVSSPSASASTSAPVPPPLPMNRPVPHHQVQGTLDSIRHTMLSLFSSTSRSNYHSPPPIYEIVPWLRYQYAQDPLRIMGSICFLLAFISWIRRTLRNRPLRGGAVAASRQGGLSLSAALRLAVQKVGDTVRMGTRITTL